MILTPGPRPPERPNMCWDCPHGIPGDEMNDETEREMLEAMADCGEHHECHNNTEFLCVGSRIGVFFTIEEK